VTYSQDPGLSRVTIACAMSPTIPGELVKYPAIWAGNSRMLTAKMIGITPAWLTRSGRNVWPPWYIRRPRTRDAYCTGIRRCPSWTKMITATAAIARMANSRILARSGLVMKPASAPGARLTMPAR